MKYVKPFHGENNCERGEGFWFNEKGKLYMYKYTNEECDVLKDFDIHNNTFTYKINVNEKEVLEDLHMLKNRFGLDLDTEAIKMIEEFPVGAMTHKISSRLEEEKLVKKGFDEFKTPFFDQKMQGASIGNYPNGAIKYEYSVDENGSGHHTNYHQNGEVKSRITWKNHYLLSIAKYHETGTLKKEVFYDHNHVKESFKSYNTDGEIEEEWIYRNGRLINIVKKP